MTTLARIHLLGIAAAAVLALPACSEQGATTMYVTAAQCDSAGAWSAWTAYAMGNVVSFEGSHYVCVQSHTSQPGWVPAAVPALWAPAQCLGDGSGNNDPDTGGGDSGGASCDSGAWVYMGDDPNGCAGHAGESCGWTATNLGQGYHCQNVSWGVGCSPGGDTCPGGDTGGGDTGTPSAGFVFSPYKDTSINLNWNTNVATTRVSGSPVALATDLVAHGAPAVTLAFATGECGTENWGGVSGGAMAAANVDLLNAAGVDYILATGGAAGSFTCGSDAGMSAFIERWASPHLIGIDFDIEAGQSQAVINALVQRIKAAHLHYPGLRFSLTIATLANNNGASTAQSLGSGLAQSLNAYGVWTMQAAQNIIGSWPSYLTVNLMTMDYGAAGSGVCIVSGGVCDMGQSAIQAAYNLHDQWGVPFANIELTPMIGGNDVSSEHFTLADVDTMTSFAVSHNLAGIHYWSYDRDTDCAQGYASPTCNSVGGAGNYGFLSRFLSHGL